MTTIKQHTAAPTRKVTAAGIGGVAGTLIAAAFSASNVPFLKSSILKGNDEELRALMTKMTEDEALEMIVALVQLYREQGHYLERMYKWLKRVGMDSIRAVIVEDPARRRGYYEAFVHSQTFSQTDPWSERASGARASHEFRPMADLTLEAAE